ncbi:MAG: MFS transporter [Deltaproteobacteria bacterium]|nr:MFS transporter [Deltaproteobacteria bacterium]
MAQHAPRFRFVVMFALWMTLFFLFLDRVNIALAAPYIMDELKLSGVETGVMLSAYYWGYVAGQLGGGIAADRWSIRRWASVMFFFWCVLTALTGMCRSLTQLALVRGLFGVSEGAVANPLHKLENHWLLPDERGRVYGLSMGFGYLGLILGTPLVGWLIESWGWRVMFFGTGGLTLLGVGLFWLLVYDHPHQHPWVSAEERALIAEAVGKDRVTFDPHRHEAPPLSFRAGVDILTKNPVFWLLCIAGFCALGVFFTNLSWLPGYLVKERGYAVATSGVYLILPYVAAFAGALLAGYLGDRTGNRSAVALVTGVLTGPAILAMLFSDTVTSVILFMSLVLFLNAAATNSLIVLLFDLFPAEVLGITVAIFAGVCGGAGGIVGPIALGRSYDQTGSFFWGFCSLAGAALVAALVLIPVALYERRVKKEKRDKAALAQALALNEPVALRS